MAGICRQINNADFAPLLRLGPNGIRYENRSAHHLRWFIYCNMISCKAEHAVPPVTDTWKLGLIASVKQEIGERQSQAENKFGHTRGSYGPVALRTL